MTQIALSRELGISKSLLTKYKKQGCPIDQGADAVRRWRKINVQDRVANLGCDIEGNGDDNLQIEDLTYTLPEGEEITDAFKRLRLTERTLFAEIQSIQEYLKTHNNPKLARQLPTKRHQYFEASKAATAVWRTIKSMDAGNELKEALEAADKYVDAILKAVFYRFKILHLSLPEDCGRKGCEKAVRDAFLAVWQLGPSVFERSGLSELHARAQELVEQKVKEAKQAAEI